jgi:hypothetical protein
MLDEWHVVYPDREEGFIELPAFRFDWFLHAAGS